MTGFATALNEITLVLFTTLAPSGAVAYVIMGMAALRAQGDERKRLSGALLIPFLVTLVGSSPRLRIWAIPITRCTCSRV